MKIETDQKIKDISYIITAISWGLMIPYLDVLKEGYQERTHQEIKRQIMELPNYNLPETPQETKQRFERRYVA